MQKWQRQGWLSEIDLRRILCCFQNMRMLCNSTFLFDKRTHHSPKLAEFREIIRELTLEENRKVVVFSEYERMTFLAGEELRKMGIGFVSLHGGVPSRKRGALIEEFYRQPNCRVFLSTDAGGVGLNLQGASAVCMRNPQILLLGPLLPRSHRYNALNIYTIKCLIGRAVLTVIRP
jgi:SNF2 family DNA or RNA helicase